MLRLSLVALVVSSATLVTQTPCTEPPPAGFKAFDAQAWDGPWVFDARTSAPLPSYSKLDAPVPIRLDDGSRGAVRVIASPCQPGQPCETPDCGCLKNDRFRVDVTDARGQAIGSRILWAAYGLVTMVPVDLTGGPGDELLIVRVPAHSAPPSGNELRIWLLDMPMPADLVTDSIMIAQGFMTMPIHCARWWSRLSMDPAASKPRALSIQHELGSLGCCRILDDAERPTVAALRGERRIEFDAASGRYRDRWRR
jgi:hypothetical protein